MRNRLGMGGDRLKTDRGQVGIVGLTFVILLFHILEILMRAFEGPDSYHRILPAYSKRTESSLTYEQVIQLLNRTTLALVMVNGLLKTTGFLT